MEAFNALAIADEIKTFPSINMPNPHAKTSINKSKKRFNVVKDEDPLPTSSIQTKSFPSILRTEKTKLESMNRSGRKDETSVYVGFSASNLKLDVNPVNDLYINLQSPTQMNTKVLINSEPQRTSHNSEIRTSNTALHNQQQLQQRGTTGKSSKDVGLDELRSYITLMDKFSLHNIMIYEGRTLKDNPEFQSFKRKNQSKWGAINSILHQIEEYLSTHDIKLAIISGPRISDLAKLDNAILTNHEIHSCIANIDQIEQYLNTGMENSSSQFEIAIAKIQSLCRKFLAIRHYNKLKTKLRSVIKLQSIGRRIIQRLKLRHHQLGDISKSDDRTVANKVKLQTWWTTNHTTQSVEPSHHVTIKTTSSSNKLHNARTRLIIFIPSISGTEYIRLNTENFQAVENSHITCLSLLHDPDVHLLYITPFHITTYETIYYDKFLALLGIPVLPKRLHFLTPELLSTFPPHMTISQLLWSSSNTLMRIRSYVNSFPISYILPGMVSWSDIRIANYLDIPILGSDPVLCEAISSKSYLKKIFTQAGVNIPVGAHDIQSIDDLHIALSRLIASNLGVCRWIIRLNYDINDESVVYLEAEKIPLILTLRAEQNAFCGPTGNISGWFTRQVQLPIRRRIVTMLKKDLVGRAVINRSDIYPSWEVYSKLIKQFGAVIEAEPIETLGFVNGLCFISPMSSSSSSSSSSGEGGGGSCQIDFCRTVEVVMDSNAQEQAYIYPQTVLPYAATEGATAAIARSLFEKYGIIGYVTVKYQVYWDALDNIPRLFAYDLKFGFHAVFGALGTAILASRPPSNTVRSSKTDIVPLSLISDDIDGKFFVYIPIALHNSLRACQDDIFFKLCRMKGIAFDVQNRVGTLFPLIDKIVGGSLSIISIGNSRQKSLDIMIQTLTFICEQFGKDQSTGLINKSNHLASILSSLQKVARRERKV